jgi:hypothetical protein
MQSKNGLLGENCARNLSNSYPRAGFWGRIPGRIHFSRCDRGFQTRSGDRKVRNVLKKHSAVP